MPTPWKYALRKYTLGQSYIFRRRQPTGNTDQAGASVDEEHAPSSLTALPKKARQPQDIFPYSEDKHQPKFPCVLPLPNHTKRYAFHLLMAEDLDLLGRP
ncbi:hypothetical protein V6N13_036744 [Hibiscus sabdariffa]